MKLGPVELHWNPRSTTLADSVRRYLEEDPGVPVMISRMARSEVKNYMAELAEQAEIPFTDPAAFVRGLDHLTWLVTGKPLNPGPLVYHGPDCPGHTTGTPSESCIGATE